MAYKESTVIIFIYSSVKGNGKVNNYINMCAKHYKTNSNSIVDRNNNRSLLATQVVKAMLTYDLSIISPRNLAFLIIEKWLLYSRMLG